LSRAEELKQHSNQPSSSKTLLENALTPSQKYQQLYTLSSSSKEIREGLEAGRKAELYLYEKRLDVALESFKSALTMLMPQLTKEPKGQRRELLHQVIKSWIQEAESIKSLLSAQKAEAESESISHHSCCVQ
jgi:serine/threonine-protein kinase ULK/ATG1